MRLGDLKQEVMRINNRVNQEVFGSGLVWQRVDVIGSRVLVILAENRRLKALSSLNGAEELTARLADIALLRQYKERLRRHLEEGLGVSVRSVLKDYDGEAQLAGTVVFLETNLPLE